MTKWLALALGAVESEALREPALRRLAELSEDRWVRLAIASSSRSAVFVASLLNLHAVCAAIRSTDPSSIHGGRTATTAVRPMHTARPATGSVSVSGTAMAGVSAACGFAANPAQAEN